MAAFGISIVGNSQFAREGATIYTGGLVSHDGSDVSFTYYAFLKPSDRVTFSAATNSTSATCILKLVRITSGQVALNQDLNGQLFLIFSSPARGGYLINATIHPSSNQTQAINDTITVVSGKPNDGLLLGIVFTFVGLLAAVVCLAMNRFRRLTSLPSTTAESGSAARDTGKSQNKFIVLLRAELFSSGRIFFVVPIFFAIAYSAGAFDARFLSAPQNISRPNLADLFAPSLTPYSDWLNIFPVVVALTAYSFAYEREARILRSLLLNPIRLRSVFLAKFTALCIIVETPIVVGITVASTMFDPQLALSEPASVYGNLLAWLFVYLLYGLVMIGLALLPSVLFRKPMYSFVVPVFIVLIISTEGFGLDNSLPWNVWLVNGIGVLSSLNFQTGFDFGGFIMSALPSSLLALMLSLLAFVVFQIQSKE